MAEKKHTYESAMEELQRIVTQIQDETVGMDELTDKVKRASDLIRFCKEKLRETEEELEKVKD